MNKIITSIFITLVSMSTAMAEISVDLQASQISIVRIHTTHHANSSAQRHALVQISGLLGGCTSGIFFNASQNVETLSLVLSAFVAKNNIKLGYEPSFTSPWRDPTYCALTYFDVK